MINTSKGMGIIYEKRVCTTKNDGCISPGPGE